MAGCYLFVEKKAQLLFWYFWEVISKNIGITYDPLSTPIFPFF